MVGGGPFQLEPGQWTDDTSMALCLAESLIESGGFDAGDQMGRFVRPQSGKLNFPLVVRIPGRTQSPHLTAPLWFLLIL